MSNSICFDILVIAPTLADDLYSDGLASVEFPSSLLTSVENNANLIANAAFRLADVKDGDYSIEVGEKLCIFKVQSCSSYAYPKELNNLFFDYIYNRMPMHEEYDLVYTDLEECLSSMKRLRAQGEPCTMKRFGSGFMVSRKARVDSDFYLWNRTAKQIENLAKISQLQDEIVSKMPRPTRVLMIRR
jgi:hypothetical protein